MEAYAVYINQEAEKWGRLLKVKCLEASFARYGMWRRTGSTDAMGHPRIKRPGKTRYHTHHHPTFLITLYWVGFFLSLLVGIPRYGIYQRDKTSSWLHHYRLHILSSLSWPHGSVAWCKCLKGKWTPMVTSSLTSANTRPAESWFPFFVLLLCQFREICGPEISYRHLVPVISPFPVVSNFQFHFPKRRA
jgi:hypothetical protein